MMKSFGSISFKRKTLVALLIPMVPLLILIDGFAVYTIGNEFVKMIFVSFLNSNIYPLKNLLTSRVCISLETPYSKASSHFPIASHLQ